MAVSDPWFDLRKRLKGIDEQIRRLRNTSPFAGTGFTVAADGVTQVNGSLVVQSGETKSGNFAAGSTGWHLDHTGNAEFNDLTLRGGIIGNSALTNPVSTGQAFVGTSGFGLSVAGAWLLTRTATVPTGFDTCTVSAFGRVAAINSTGTGDGLYSTLDVNGSGGNQFSTYVPAGQASTSTVGFSTTLTGLTAGASVVTRLFASTGIASWAANGANGADLSVTYLWTR
jgi:hypothetical protein